MEAIFRLIFWILLFICCFYDIKDRIIPNRCIAIFVLAGIGKYFIFNSSPIYLLGFVVPSLPLVLIKFNASNYIGAGDIKLLAATGLWIGYLENIYGFIWACIFALVFSFFMKLFHLPKVYSVPFAPFLAVSFLFLFAFNCI